MCLALCACAKLFPDAILFSNLHYNSMKQILELIFIQVRKRWFHLPNIIYYRKEKARFWLRFAYSKVHAVNTSLACIYVNANAPFLSGFSKYWTNAWGGGTQSRDTWKIGYLRRAQCQLVEQTNRRAESFEVQLSSRGKNLGHGMKIACIWRRFHLCLSKPPWKCPLTLTGFKY